jgi:HEAT repeat protein
VGALIVLGEPAVPKLVQTLTNPDPQIRIYAAVCLGNIQGRAARQALTEALSIEPDGDVQKEIRISIAAIDRGV